MCIGCWMLQLVAGVLLVLDGKWIQAARDNARQAMYAGVVVA